MHSHQPNHKSAAIAPNSNTNNLDNTAADTKQPSQLNTAALKQQILQLSQDRDTEPLNQKVLFFNNTLAPLFEELSRRNPHPSAEEQVPLMPGVWSPVWSTIPFQDTLPGRIRNQSYQIFHDDGYYANIARYAPGYRLSFLQKLSSILVAYDLMFVQKFEVRNGQWYIQNIGIKQALRMKAIPLSINKAEEWFTTFITSGSQQNSSAQTGIPKLGNLDQRTAKRFKTAFRATPQFEHLYIDRDFRLVRTQREAKQRPSYTLAVRRSETVV